MGDERSYSWSGEPGLAEAVDRALHRVVDPEMGLDIVEMGLVYGVEVSAGRVQVRMTMTSAACPVTEMIVEDVGHELRAELGEGTQVDVEVVMDPPWTPERLSERAREVLDW
jgi:metal-sulfur cluster biosynthetic enzyme